MTSHRETPEAEITESLMGYLASEATFAVTVYAHVGASDGHAGDERH